MTVRYDYPIGKWTSDADYLALLRAQLPEALEEFKPQLIFYNAGTDIYENDPHGKLKITREGIIARDEFVFRQARSRGIPIVMVLSGGYAPQVFKIIGESIENLVTQELISIP